MRFLVSVTWSQVCAGYQFQIACYHTTLFSSATVVITDFTANYSDLGMCDVRHFCLPVYPSCSCVLSNLLALDIHLHILAVSKGFASFSSLEPILLATTVSLVQFRVDP